MVKKWTEVITSPEFQSLSADEKNQAKLDYFQEVVAPNVPSSDVGNAFSQFNQEFPDYESGVAAAAGAGMERVGLAWNTLTGDEAGAAENKRQLSRFDGMSFEEADSIGDYVQWFGESIVGDPIGSAALVASVAAAPVTGGGSLAAGTAFRTALSGVAKAALPAAYGVQEGANTYAYQEEKDLARAALTGMGTALLTSKTPLNALRSKELGGKIGRLAIDSADAGLVGTSQYLLAQTVGFDKPFDEAMQEIDTVLLESALLGGATSLAGIGASRVQQGRVAAKEEMQNRRASFAESSPEQRSFDRDVDLSDISAELSDLRSGVSDVSSASSVIQDVWKRDEMRNTTNALRHLKDSGFKITPDFLNIDVRSRDGGTINLAQESGIDTKASTAANALNRAFKSPLFSEKIAGNPTENYEIGLDTYKKAKNSFEMEIDKAFTGLDKDAYNSSELSGIKRELKLYASGGLDKLSDDSIVVIATHMPDALNDAVTIKRMKQVVDNSSPKGGGLESYAGFGVEAVATGGVPVISSAISAIGSLAGGTLTRKQRAKMEDILNGVEVGGKTYSVQDVQNILGALGRAGSEVDEEE